MLSSTMVTVLAPQFGGRQRRTKRFDGTGYSEAQGDLQEVSNTSPNQQQGLQGTWSQHGVKNVLADSLNTPQRASLLETRRNTAGWSSKSDPSSFDFNTKRDMIQTVSLDSDVLSLSPTSPMSWSPLSPNLVEQRNTQIDLEGKQPSASPKPTTSNLLSFRRFHSNGTNSSHIPVLPEVKPSSLSSSLNNNEERTNYVLSPSLVSKRTTESRPVLSPVGFNDKERNISNKFLFLASPTNPILKDNSCTQQCKQVQMTPTSFSSSKPPLQGKGHLERKQYCENSDKTNSLSESSILPSKYLQYEHTAPLKTQTVPRRTNLKSTSWWKQVSQEGSSPLSVKNTNKKDDRKTDSQSPTESKRLGSYMLNNNDNNNTVKLLCKHNMNLSTKTRSPESDKGRIQQHDLNVDNRAPQKPQSMPDWRSGSKLSTVSTPTTLRLTKASDKNDERKTLFTTQVPAPSLTPLTSNPPADSVSKYNVPPPKTTSSPTSQNNIDTQNLTRLPSFQTYATTPTNQTHSFQAISNSSSCSTPKNTFSFQSHQVSSNTNILSPSSNTSKLSPVSNVTPLGFKRSYVCLPKPFNAKPVTSFTPTIKTFNQGKGSYILATPTTTVATTPCSPSNLSLSVVSARTSPTTMTSLSLLTPPATPVIASPTSESSAPKLKGIVYNSLERDPKKNGKRERRVTWHDSVEGQYSEPVNVEKPDPTQVQGNSCPPELPHGSPSTFSCLQSGTSEAGGSSFNNKQLEKGEKYRSLSSDCGEVVTRERDKSKQIIGDSVISDQGKQGPSTAMHERTLSVESAPVECHYSAPLSLPPDFPRGYKHRYSTTPYSTLMSARQTHEELNKSPQTFLISKTSHSNHTPQTSSNAEQLLAKHKPSLSPISLSQSFTIPFQSGTSKEGSSKCNLSDSDWVNNNTLPDYNHDQPNSQIQLFDNRVHISSQSNLGNEQHSFSSTCVTETLVYRIKSKTDAATDVPKNTTPTYSQHNANSLVSVEAKFKQHLVQSNEAVGQSFRHSDKSSSEDTSTKTEGSLDEISNTSMKESVMGKSRFYSVEGNNEDSPKKSMFSIKRSVSTPISSLSRPESERATKSSNKVDQMITKLKQKFSSKRTEDDLSFPWKWRRPSQTPSISGSSDKSSISDVSADSTKALEDRTLEKKIMLKDITLKTENTKTQTESRYPLLTAPSFGERMTGKEVQDNNIVDPISCAAPQSKIHLTVQGPVKQFEMYDNNDSQHTSTNQIPSCSDQSVDGSHSPNPACPSQCNKCTPSPRSPFSPFSSLTPVSPFSAPEVFDDSVFYSPKLQRSRESSPPFDPLDGIRLRASRRSRASTGPPTSSPGKDKETFPSFYADLKYGIEPGRSYSVSSVLSSRPARPGRISTGTRFMSVGDLSHPTLSSTSNNSDLHEGSITPTEMGQLYTQPGHDPHMSQFPYDAEKQRSRSLPRSLSQCLAKWSSGVSSSQSGTPSKPSLLHSPSMNICHFPWDTEGPPTPPPTPPLSPAPRRMSRPPSLPSPSFPSSPEAVHQVDGQSSRMLWPSRSFSPNLDTFDESSNSSSDTTTDDEYYIEDGEKETEL